MQPFQPPQIMTSVSFQCHGEDGQGLYPSARSHLGPREAPCTWLGCEQLIFIPWGFPLHRSKSIYFSGVP